MEEYIKNKLLKEGETIRWIGRPTKVKLLEKPYTAPIIARWVIAALLLVFEIWYLLIFDGTVNMPVAGLALLIAIYVVADPLWVVNRLHKGTLYCLTERRAIACYKARPMKVKFRAMEEIDEVSVEKLSNGCGVVYIGKKTPDASKQARYQSSLSDLEDASVGRIPLMFYSVEDYKTVCDQLELTRKAASAK